MRSKISLKWLSFIGGAFVIAFSTILIFLPDTTALGSGETASAVSPEQVPSGLPIRLRIPAIRVDAAILPVGLAPDGAMDVPKGPDDTAWFDQGPHPGENGTAVIAGHFGWKNGIPAVFDNLNELHPGNKILVENDKGETITFVIRELRTFDGNGNATEVFSSSDGKAHLNLITCEGVWDKASKSYSNRLVVFADKI